MVTWGILAYLASTPRARRWLSAVSAVVSLGVGMTTVYLGTHWLSDVLLGWAAGLLILLALPWCEPLIARAEAAIFDLRDRWRARGGRPRRPAAPVGAPALLKPRAGRRRTTTSPAREPVGAPRAARARAPGLPRPGPAHDPLGAHPGHPGGSRRPPHSDRVPRGAHGLRGPPADGRLTPQDSGGRYAQPTPARRRPRLPSRNRGLRRAGRSAVVHRPAQPFQAAGHHAVLDLEVEPPRRGTPW